MDLDPISSSSAKGAAATSSTTGWGGERLRRHVKYRQAFDSDEALKDITLWFGRDMMRRTRWTFNHVCMWF